FNYSEFGNRNLNLIFGSNSNMIDMFIVQYYFDHIFGVSIGWFLALIFGAVLLLAAYKAKD
ncbi:MAG: hypothetical protein HWN66_07045, partial [Candidatus Helarchaeota archaeon]|nr:hypothetical protein [Candidatus Helarchaeota archaeon]